MADGDRHIYIESSQGVLAGNTIDAGGDVIVNGLKVTNIFQNTDYQELVKRIKSLEEDLERIPLENKKWRLEKSRVVVL